MKRSFLVGLIAVLSLLVVSQAFAEKNLKATSATKNPEIVATVNGLNITRAELDAITSESIGNSDSDAQKKIKKSALNTLINQALVFEAVNKKMPPLSSADALRLEFLKKDAAFSFYLTRMAPNLQQQPTSVLDDYMRSHPKFFSDRKVYHFVRYSIENNNPRVFDFVKAAVDQGELKGGLSNLLSAQKVRFTRTNYWYGAEQLSPPVLSLLESMNVDSADISFSPDKRSIEVTFLYGVYPDPISIDDGRSMVQEGGAKVYGAKTIQALLNDLRAKAKIDISEEFLESTTSKESLDAVEASANYFQKSIPAREWVLAAWNLILLILVPTCVVSLYKYIQENKKNSGNLDRGVVEAPHSLLIIHDLRVPILVILPMAMLSPLFLYLSHLPQWMTIARFMGLFFAAISVGLLIVISTYKIGFLKDILKNKWIVTAGLIVVETVVFLVTQG